MSALPLKLTLEPGLFFKATDENGRDFHTGIIDYAGALATGEVVRHPTSTKMRWGHPRTYLGISITPTDTLATGKYPFRLFAVEPVGEVLQPQLVELPCSILPIKTLQPVSLPTWRGVLALKVVEELNHTAALGPNATALSAFFQRVCELEGTEVVRLGEAYREPSRLYEQAIHNASCDSGGFIGGHCARVWTGREVLQKHLPELPENVVQSAAKAVGEAAMAVFYRDGGLDDIYIDHLSRPWLEAFGEPP